MTAAALVQLVLAIWTVISPAARLLPHAREIAEAIADVVLEDQELAPVYATHEEDLAHMAYFAMRESSLDPHAVGDGGRAHGVWQLHGACGLRSVEEQARCWMAMLRASKCRAHPVAVMWGACSGPVPYGRVEQLAAVREKRAMELLAKARTALAGAAEAQSR